MTESQQDERAGLPSASNWRRYELCAGSWQLEQEAKALKQEAHVRSVDAERGNLIHAYLAGEVDEDGREIKLSETEQTTADFLQERAQGEAQRIFGDAPVQQLNEKRLWLFVNGRQLASGRFDRVLYSQSVALLQDFKTGWSEPDPAEQNAQLKVLAVLVGLYMPHTVKEVIVQIVSGPFGITEARYDVPALAQAYNNVLATLRSLRAVDAPLSPSPEACKWCPAVNCCQAVKNLILPVATKTQISALPDGERGARLLDEVEVIAGHLETIKAYYARQLTEDPAFDLPGYAMTPGAVRREVKDWETARKRLAEWLDLSEIEAASNYRLGDLERALGKKLKLKGPLLKERMNQILQGLIEEKPNAASLKRVSGKPKIPTLADATLP